MSMAPLTEGRRVSGRLRLGPQSDDALQPTTFTPSPPPFLLTPLPSSSTQGPSQMSPVALLL